MDEKPTQEGTAPFALPSVSGQSSTYYKIFGNLRMSKRPPVIVLHGGPGSGHEYVLPFAKLWRRYGIPVIFYDQIGCASSTHLREKAGDKEFWGIEPYVQQPDQLLEFLALDQGRGYHIVGHSWGGLLAFYYATRQPDGLRGLILASTAASADRWAQSFQFRVRELGQEAQEAWEQASRTDDYKSPGFQKLTDSLRKAFWCLADPYPREIELDMKNQAGDRTSVSELMGNVPLQCTGAMHNWTCESTLSRIQVPTLIYYGEFDIARDEAISQLMKNIPDVRKAVVMGASHMAHVDSIDAQDRILELIGTFIVSNKMS